MSGNAALAKGGSGDTLAGTIGGLLAQGIETGNAKAGAGSAGAAASGAKTAAGGAGAKAGAGAGKQ